MVKLFSSKKDWTFDITKMKPAAQLLFAGMVIVITVMLGFFAGLFIDMLLQQYAFYAYWGIGLGAVTSLVILYKQAMRLVEFKKDKALDRAEKKRIKSGEPAFEETGDVKAKPAKAARTKK